MIRLTICSPVFLLFENVPRQLTISSDRFAILISTDEAVIKIEIQKSKCPSAVDHLQNGFLYNGFSNKQISKFEREEMPCTEQF